MKISYSSFDTYKRCPLQYKYAYIERLPTPEKPELYFGGLIHEIVQYALKKDPILPTEDELVSLFKSKWRADVFASVNDASQYFDFGLDMIKKFYADWKPGLRNIIATEKRFYLPLNEKHNLSGIIDRVDKLPFGAIEVIDYKTSKALPSQIDVDRDKQLGVYRLAIESMWPEVKDVRLTLYYLKHNQKFTTTRRPDEVEEIKNELISTADKIETTNDFPPRKNPLCDYCGYKDRCPLFSDVSTTPKELPLRPASSRRSNLSTDIDSVIDEYIELHQKMSDLESKIHKHFDKQEIESYKHKKATIARDKNRAFKIER